MSVGTWAFGTEGLFLGADEIIMHTEFGGAEICTWKSSPFALLASNVPPMTIPASHSLYANDFPLLLFLRDSSAKRDRREIEINWKRQKRRAFLLCFVFVCLVYF